jgi:hypothetical protein
MENITTTNEYQDSNKTISQCQQEWCFARYEELKIEFANSDGCVETTVLFDLEGNWTPAKWVTGKYGTSWLVLDANGRSTGVFVPFASKKRETQAKRGFVEGIARVPAEVAMWGGFSPRTGIVPAKPVGTDRPVTIISTDRFKTN